MCHAGPKIQHGLQWAAEKTGLVFSRVVCELLHSLFVIGTICVVPLMNTIYFDYNATTPLDPNRSRCDGLPYFDEVWGNPFLGAFTSVEKARSCLDEFRDRSAADSRRETPSEIVSPAAGTESVNLAYLGARARAQNRKGRHLITSAVEHHAVLHSCEYLAKKEEFDLTVRRWIRPVAVSRWNRSSTRSVRTRFCFNSSGQQRDRHVATRRGTGRALSKQGRFVPHRRRSMVRQGTVRRAIPSVQRRSGFHLRAPISRTERRRRACLSIIASLLPIRFLFEAAAHENEPSGRHGKPPGHRGGLCGRALQRFVKIPGRVDKKLSRPSSQRV